MIDAINRRWPRIRFPAHVHCRGEGTHLPWTSISCWRDQNGICVLNMTPMNHETILRIYFVRHGETNENRAAIVQGQLDTDLNEDGIKQSHLCAKVLKDVNFVVGFSSDLKRASDVSIKTLDSLLLHCKVFIVSMDMLCTVWQTATIIMKYHPEVELLKDPGLRERVSQIR